MVQTPPDQSLVSTHPYLAALNPAYRSPVGIAGSQSRKHAMLTGV